ncbi:MAG: thiamine pyrophosphate-dependent enzyme [Burkholderiaceae bacterium]
MTVDLDAMPLDFVLPVEHRPPASVGSLHVRAVDLPSLGLEERLAAKLDAVLAFARVNSVDKHIVASPAATLGIVTVGKAHYDFMEVLPAGPGPECPGRRRRAGLQGRPGVPAGATRIAEFARGLEEILVIEEKAPIVERQIKEQLYGLPDGQRPASPARPHPRARRCCRHSASCALAHHAHRGRLAGAAEPGAGPPPPGGRLPDARAAAQRGRRGAPPALLLLGAARTTPAPRCPRARALAGIGCHFMASWMERGTSGLIQMGAEGVDWVAHSRFTKEKHVFQNLGDGTYFHSGLLAIRQAIAAGANITYKLLYNDAVAMTGGQPVDGQISVPEIARQVEAEGAKRVVIVSDEIEKYDGHEGEFPAGTTFHPRSELDAVQRELREVEGVTLLIYDQTCAAEKRRRKKKEFPDPPRRVFINQAVCEGCGDCGQASNCLSVVPVEPTGAASARSSRARATRISPASTASAPAS